VLGGLVAADLRLSPRVVSGLAVAVGLLHGWFNGAGIAEAGREALGLLGIASVTFVLVALVAALVVSLRLAWQRIAVRVVGSWVAAVGLLVLGWSVRGNASP
jgi:urease accessory protein